MKTLMIKCNKWSIKYPYTTKYTILKACSTPKFYHNFCNLSLNRYKQASWISKIKKIYNKMKKIFSLMV